MTVEPATGRMTLIGDLARHGMSIYKLEQAEDAADLSRLMRDSESPAVRGRAAEALGEVGGDDDAVVEELIRTAVDDEDEEVRASVVDALDGIGGDALERLIARMGDHGVETQGGPPVDAFVDALGQEMPELRMAAANAIGRAEVVEAVPALLARLDDDNRHVKYRAVRATGKVGDERAVGPLLSLTDDPDSRVRRAVATSLGEIGADRGLDGLLQLHADEYVGVRLAAIRALGAFSDPRPIEPLIGCFADQEDEVRRAAAYAIVELLSNAPPGRSHEMRTQVVDALASTQGEVVTGALTELFDESTEPHRRRNAAWLLGRVTDGARTTIETLVDALSDDDEMVRQFAATSLAELDSESDSSEVEDVLLEALDSTSGEGRSMVLFTLGTVGTEASRERLVRLIDEVDAVETQERALAALSRLGGA